MKKILAFVGIVLARNTLSNQFRAFLQIKVNASLFAILMASHCYDVAAQSVYDWKFDYLTINEGLSHNTVSCILEDERGFVWIGTGNGLDRYDGYEFHSWRNDPDDVNTLPDNTVSCMIEHRGDLWIGTRNGGLCRFDPVRETFVRYGKKQAKGYQLPDDEIISLYQSSDSVIWVCSFGGVSMINSITGKSHIYKLPKGRQLSSDVTLDSLGNFWVATDGPGIFQFSPENEAFVLHWEAPGKNYVLDGFRKTLLTDHAGNIWVGTYRRGLFVIENGATKLKPVASELSGGILAGQRFMDILQWNEEVILAATDGLGLIAISGEGENIQLLQSNPLQAQALNTDALFCLLKDRIGNLWIGTYNGGVNVHKTYQTFFDRFIPDVSKGSSLGNRSVLSFLEDQRGQIWIGTDGGGLNQFDRETGEFLTLRNDPTDATSLPGDVVTEIFEDRSGQIWIGTFDRGLARFDPIKRQFQPFRASTAIPNQLTNSNVWSIDEDKDGYLWIGTVGGGLNLFDPERETFEKYEHPASLIDDEILVVEIDRQNKLWFATLNQGLGELDIETNTLKLHRHDPSTQESLSHDQVRAILEDSRDRLWIGTEGGGLNLMRRDGTFEHFKKENGLPDNSIMGILEDEEGRIWLSTFNGLGVLDPETGTCFNFGLQDGLQSRQFNLMAACKTSGRELLFGGIYGFNAILPQDLQINPFAPPIWITQLNVQNRPVEVGRNQDLYLPRAIYAMDTLSLTYEENAFSLEFAALDFTNPYRNRYSFRLDGFDKIWNEVDANHRRASYTNLNGGEYVFRVKGTNQNGIWSEERTLLIKVAPPWWNSGWFRSILSASLILIILSIMKYLLERRRRKLEQEIFVSEKRYLESEKRYLELQTQSLQQDLENQHAKLSASALQMAHKNVMLNELALRLQEIKTESEGDTSKHLQQLISRIQRELKAEDYWSQFHLHFDQVHRDFSQRLQQTHEGISANDLRMCALIRLELNTKEIASILNISVKGVEKSRYRLKKKLGLSTEDSLPDYIRTF